MPERPPPPPPVWQRLARLPRTLGRELTRAIGWWWRARRNRPLGDMPARLHRAWLATDPYSAERFFAEIQSGPIIPSRSPAPPPAPGTRVMLQGILHRSSVEWPELLLDDHMLDDAILAALELGPHSSPCPVEIAIRVVEPGSPST